MMSSRDPCHVSDEVISGYVKIVTCNKLPEFPCPRLFLNKHLGLKPYSLFKRLKCCLTCCWAYCASKGHLWDYSALILFYLVTFYIHLWRCQSDHREFCWCDDPHVRWNTWYNNGSRTQSEKGPRKHTLLAKKVLTPRDDVSFLRLFLFHQSARSKDRLFGVISCFLCIWCPIFLLCCVLSVLTTFDDKMSNWPNVHT